MKRLTHWFGVRPADFYFYLGLTVGPRKLMIPCFLICKMGITTDIIAVYNVCKRIRIAPETQEGLNTYYYNSRHIIPNLQIRKHRPFRN